jgi:hypothetical protein
MKSYTLDNLKRDTTQDGLYDIFRQTIIAKNVAVKQDYIHENEVGRLDLFCKRIYGDDKYFEELKLLNNIVNEWNVNANDIIYFANTQDMESFRDLEKDETVADNIANTKNKSTRVDPNRSTGVPPTIKPSNFDQIIVDKKNKKIKINNKLQ